MNISIEQGILKTIQAHLESAYPYEACGFLLGLQENENRIITKSIQVENISTENQRRRFIIDPLDYLRTEKLALHEKLILLGIYHSHPDNPAVPSIHDLEFAQPFFSYFIHSIYSGQLTDTHSYRLIAGKFIEEKISISISPRGFRKSDIDPPQAEKMNDGEIQGMVISLKLPGVKSKIVNRKLKS